MNGEVSGRLMKCSFFFLEPISSSHKKFLVMALGIERLWNMHWKRDVTTGGTEAHAVVLILWKSSHDHVELRHLCGAAQPAQKNELLFIQHTKNWTAAHPALTSLKHGTDGTVNMSCAIAQTVQVDDELSERRHTQLFKQFVNKLLLTTAQSAQENVH